MTENANEIQPKEQFIVELADGGPWLKKDLTWTPEFSERGVWDSAEEAGASAEKSLRKPVG